MLTLVRSWIERIACANSGATEMISTLEPCGSSSGSIVSVMNMRLMQLASILATAPFENTPCDTAA